ncbi:tyrosinase family oxidase copper chaperone [Streptomyces sp. NPDC019208]|uniref:apotyrosinase chaperone MelC1 n=1 Tax=Streptomyces sp. NPDC019208 TaxID=3154683 RepID=UPI0033E8F87C
MQRPTRREAVRVSMLALTGAVIAAPATVAAAKGLRTGSAATTRAANRPNHGTEQAAAAEPEAFDEMYLGRHIEGMPADGGHGSHAGHGGHGGPAGHGTGGRPAGEPGDPVAFVVRVDDDDLHVMQNADGTWISVVNHYEKYRTPRDAARAAVRELHGASLVPVTV